jgi:hypothetical protein
MRNGINLGKAAALPYHITAGRRCVAAVIFFIWPHPRSLGRADKGRAALRRRRASRYGATSQNLAETSRAYASAIAFSSAGTLTLHHPRFGSRFSRARAKRFGVRRDSTALWRMALAFAPTPVRCLARLNAGWPGWHLRNGLNLGKAAALPYLIEVGATRCGVPDSWPLGLTGAGALEIVEAGRMPALPGADGSPCSPANLEGARFLGSSLRRGRCRPAPISIPAPVPLIRAMFHRP